MPKRRAKFQLPPDFGRFLGGTVIKRAQQLIMERKLTGAGISNKMAKEGLRISEQYVYALRRSMSIPALFPKAPPLSAEVVKRAKQLIAKRKLNDYAIARLMKKEGFGISPASVFNLRFGMKLPPLPFPSLSLIVNRAKRLIAKREFDDHAIAHLMAGKGLPISASSVARIRRSMDIPPAITKRTSREAQMRANQVKNFRLEFKALSKEQIIAKWNRLRKTEQIIKRRRAGLGKLKDKERIGAFITQLGEIKMQFEALFPLLPEEMQQAEAVYFVKGFEAMKKKQ